MTTEQFWEIIASSRSKGNSKQPEASRKRQIEYLLRLLSALPPDEIAAFERRYGELHSAAYHWDLWAAAYLHDGGCSDDGFHYFRDWLIAQGKAAYEAALQNADSLADVFPDPEEDTVEFEEFGYVVDTVYRQKTNHDLPNYERNRSPEPAGQPWNDDTDEGDAELARRLPNLYAKFGADEE